MDRVRWSEIEAECGDYRAGFVGTFRKYEGQATDEKDAQNRVVKVTANSFARHMKIPPATFREWVRQDGGAEPRGHVGTPRDEAGARKVLRDPEQRRKVIEALDEDERLAVAQDAMRPSMQREERGQKERRAHRESRPAHDRTHLEAIKNMLNKVDIDLLSAVTYAKDTTWTPEGTALALERIEQTRMRLELLEMAVKSEGDIEAELARIGEEV